MHTIVTNADIVGQLKHSSRFALRSVADKAHILITALSAFASVFIVIVF